MTWQDKAEAATRGTRLGAMIAAILGRTIEGPHFIGKASVTSDGFLIASFQTKAGAFHHGAFAGELPELVSNLERLAEHLALSPAERGELASATVEWIGDDYSGHAARDIRHALAVKHD